MTAPLHPRGTLRARFVPGAREDDMFRRLGIGARTCDLGDAGLYLAEELVAADRWFGGSDPLTLGVLVLALMIAQRQGSTRLPLDPRGPLKVLVTDIARLSGGDLEPAALLKSIAKLTSEPTFGSVLGYGEARLPLIVDDDCLYTERSRWLEQRVAARLAERLIDSAGSGLAGSGLAPRGRPAGSPPPDLLSLVEPELSAGAAVVAAATVVAELCARPAGRPLSEEQARAVGIALSGKLAVVTGGPGTGKTVVAGAIVRGFARLGVLARGPIALAAQTGKAANRLTQVIGEQLAAIADPDDADRQLAAAPPVAQTLHRLLGYQGGRFMHHAQNPLPVSAVIVDEASMIDLELVDALLDALPPSAPLVLVGDAHQLPAIDVGQILADLAEPDGAAALRVAVLSQSYRMDTGDVHGRAVYDAAAAVHEGAVQRLVERGGLAVPRTPGTLTFRGVEWVDTQAGQAAKEAARAGKAAARAAAKTAKAARAAAEPAAVELTTVATTTVATTTVATTTVETTTVQSAAARTTIVESTVVETTVVETAAIELAAVPAPPAPPAKPRPSKAEQETTLAVAEALWHHFDGPVALRTAHHVFRFTDGVIDPAHAPGLEVLWRLLGRARILTVTRALATGSLAINEHLHELALETAGVSGRPDFVPGEPVMVTANDYQRGLFNGDQGIIVRADEGLGRHHYRAVFRCGGQLRPFAIEALRDRLELAWALTVHKSQGSELDAVALLLPHEELPLVTRELIYTAITRARTGVVIAGSRQVLVAGGKRGAQRHSGLATRLLRATLRR